MSFTRRYFAWLFVPPAFTVIPSAFAFVVVVVQMSAGTATLTGLALAALYVAGSAGLYAMLVGQVREVERLAASGGDLSVALSNCLRKTVFATFTSWAGGALVFTIAGTLLVMPTALGASYFAVASLVACYFATAWGYFAAKSQLGAVAASSQNSVRYVGREVSLSAKIAIVFMGSFIVSSAALVQLISSKVSSTLETLAIESSSIYFDSVYGLAASQPKIDQAALNELARSIPEGYLIHYIPKQGPVLATGEALQPHELSEIRRLRNGDSAGYVGPHVSRFAELPDGSVMVVSVPWGNYASIPKQIAFYTAIIALLTMGVFGVATFFLSRDITSPLRALSQTSRQMAQGDFDATEHIFADDEVGRLAVSFSETRENLRRLIARIGGSGSTITGGVRVITGGTEMLLGRSRDQAELTESSTRAVDNVRSGISRIVSAADGVSDLTQDASSRSIEMQASAEEIARSMDHLFQSVEKTSSSTTEMNASATEMSKRAEVLAGIGEEVLSFVTQMDSTIAELRASAQSTAGLSRQAREDAESGGRAVERTVAGITESQKIATSTAETLQDLNRSVGEVTQILNVIEEITNKTNLLALNAAIIAAQAGEQGSSFTVVADEIRQLADRTRKSTKEISQIIKAVQLGSRDALEQMNAGVEHVRNNVAQAQEASGSLRKIVASASSSYEMATKISRSLEDQAQATSHLHEVTSRMSDHIAEIARSTREQARGTELLAQEAELVRDIAGQVKNATQEQSSAGSGISRALEKIAEDANSMRNLLQEQLRETDSIADASRVMLDIARQNEEVAQEFNTTVQTLVQSGRDFESEVARFKISR